MTANYKNNTNKSHFIETVQLALSDQAVLDELKNNYYAFAAQDRNALTSNGMTSFATEWINTVIDNYPNFKDVDVNERSEVEEWIVRGILYPMADDIENAQEKFEPETFEPEKADPEETQEPEKARKKINVFVTLGSKAKKGIKRAIAAIRKALTTIGNAIKNAAIKTGRKACDIANTVYSNWFVREGICFLESLFIGTAVGRIAVRIMRALNVVSGTARFFIILFGGAIIAGLLAEFVNWLNDKILSAMARKSEQY